MNKKDNVANKNKKLDKKIEMKNNHKAQIANLKNEIGEMEEIEDTTKYGEFVSSYFAWLTLEEQKKKTKRMENMTDK